MQRNRQQDKTIWLPPNQRQKWEQILAEHREALADMEINDIAPLIRWAANLATPKIIAILEEAEKQKKEK